MTSETRRQRERDELRQKIFQAASDILISEGYESLSIRKIAARIEYSPGIIYHYFKDKADLLAHFIQDGGQKMWARLTAVPIDPEDPEQTLKSFFRAYIDFALETPNGYRAVFGIGATSAVNNYEMLAQGIAKTNPVYGLACRVIALGIQAGKYRDVDLELTAQVLWLSMHGLVSRLLLEPNTPLDQQERLIEHCIDIIFNGLLRRD